MPKMPSIYLSPSAQEKNVGADGITEEDRMNLLVDDLAPILTAKGLIVYRNKPEWSLGQIIEDSNCRKPDLHIALHSNAGGGTGVETWTYKTEGTNSAKFGAKLQDAVIRAAGLPNRGIKDATKPGQIKSEVQRTDATAVLIELFFHDDPADIVAFNHNRGRVIDAIARTVLDWFQIAADPAKTYADKMVDFALLEGWLHQRRDPHAAVEWWELIAFMQSVMGREGG